MEKNKLKVAYKRYLEWFYKHCSGFSPYNYSDYKKKFGNMILSGEQEF